MPRAVPQQVPARPLETAPLDVREPMPTPVMGTPAMGAPEEWDVPISVPPPPPAARPNAAPAAEPAVVATPIVVPRPVAVADPRPSAKVVFVAEDDPAIREMLVRSLGAEYRVYEAHDGQAAFEMLQVMNEPDLLLLDVMMPRLDGIALASKLKVDKRFKAVPIVFLTGLDSPKDVVQGINAGARHYVTKPFKIQDLLSKVAKAIQPKK